MVVKSFIEALPIPEVPLHLVLMSKMVEFHDRTALICASTGTELTFGELLSATRRLASGLVRLGVRKGDVVSFFSPNNLEFIQFVLACLACGAACSTINYIYTVYELTHHLRDSEAKWIFTTAELVPKVTSAMETVPTLKKVIVRESGVPGHTSFGDLLRDDGSLYPRDLFVNAKEDVAFVPFSSGTTGLPKGVMLTHYNVLANLLQIANPVFNRPGTDDVQYTVMLLMPLFHAYGLLGITVSCLAAGARLVVLPSFEPNLFLKTIEKYKINSLPVVPPIIQFLASSPLVSKYDLSSIKYISSGAAPLASEVSDSARIRLNAEEYRQGYGMTEMTCSGTRQLFEASKRKKDSSGILLPGCEAKIVDPETGRELGVNQSGELLYKGPNVMKGYLNNKKATDETIDSEGWLHTGDIGYYDEDGEFFIVDRIKELIKYKGFQVAPAELEKLLHVHPAVADVAVVGIPDSSAGEVPRAFVVLDSSYRDKSEASVAEELKTFVANQLAPFKQLRGGVEFVPVIPKTSTGKILRRELKAKALSAGVIAPSKL